MSFARFFVKGCILAIICAALFSCYNILKKDYENRRFDVYKVSGREVFDPGATLCAAIEKSNWSGLQLSEKFRSKYNNRGNIIPNINKYSRFENGSRFIDGKRQLVIFAEEPDFIFDIYGADKITTVFYFDYTVVNNNLLEDVNLVEVKRINSMTGELVE